MSEVVCNNCESCTCDHDTAKKPPIGVKPYYVAAVNRINELLSAIGRYMNEPKLTKELIDSVTPWIQELDEQVSLIDIMLIYDT